MNRLPPSQMHLLAPNPAADSRMYVHCRHAAASPSFLFLYALKAIICLSSSFVQRKEKGGCTRKLGGFKRLGRLDLQWAIEEGVEVVAEEPAKPVPPRGSGSKRSRAAEVHNLSEKRRRSRINEKMKALQNLIPNSNKTDKASMLDEAIEYLKQLQLQVQMLSMRNGLNHPMYLFGALQPLPASQMCMGFGADNGTAMSMGLGMLPLNQDSAARNSFDPSNRSTPSHRSIVIPSVKNVSNPENSCKMEPSQSHQAPFQLPASAEEIFTEDMVARPQLAAGQTTRNLPENEMKCIAVAASQHFGGQPSSLVDDDNLEECAIGRERPEDMLSKDPENLILVQHLHGMRHEVYSVGEAIYVYCKTENLRYII
ncbi:uncharacterized protein LOC103710074 isoform X13 [Phoenix dactylifera]|uniref:Uncharacterized protein LOC103710074 isoform X13 n=1 Tax=Phoenix dactylifera TaxID=42345 RepID=A0A8B7C8E3_PHODC|nr:uncharacterized protein LOC103710074 isoform X13 [Phoenix dactylifera]